MSDIVMPRLSDSMTEGTVVRWLRTPGDYVRRGEPLVEIETDKATITYEADLEGILTLLTVQEGQTVPVGTTIAHVEPRTAPQPGVGQQPPAPLQAPPPLAPPAQPLQPAAGEYQVFDDSGLEPAQPPEHHDVTEEFPYDDQFETGEWTGDYEQTGEYGQTGEYAQTGEFDQPGERVKASPIARRLARKLGLDVAAIAGTGPGGRVVKEDVEAAADAAARAEAQSVPTQAPAPPLPVPPPAPPQPEYAYEPGGSEIQEDQLTPPAAQTGEFAPLPTPEPQLQPPQPEPQFQQPQAPPAQPTPQPQQPDPSLIPNFPPPPAPAPQQPAYGQGYPPQPGMYPPPYPQQPQPFPGPPPFVQGMTGNFPAIQPGMQPPPQQQPVQPQQPPQQPPAQQPPVQQPPAQQPPGQQGAPTATRGQSTPVEPTNAQQTVARRMAESKATAPEFFVETEVDMTTCVAYREQLRSMVSPVPSFNDFVIKATAQALRQYPNVNAAYKDGHFEQFSDVNIGMVVSASETLAVPTLFNVDQKGLAQIARESDQLSEAVRSRTITPAQLSGGTFSISNLGMYGVDRFTAILNPPQAAILAVGAINRRAVIAEDGMSLVIRQIMNMTLTCDHRILYGAEAAEFIGAIKAWLESPQLLQV